LETFANLTLDPTSSNYIAKRIGDQYTSTTDAGKLVLHGDYTNKSKYIRIEMKTTGGVPTTAVPFGFKNYKKYNSSAPDLAYTTEQKINDE
jgi:hypothetical protein